MAITRKEIRQIEMNLSNRELLSDLRRGEKYASKELERRKRKGLIRANTGKKKASRMFSFDFF